MQNLLIWMNQPKIDELRSCRDAHAARIKRKVEGRAMLAKGNEWMAAKAKAASAKAASAKAVRPHAAVAPHSCQEAEG